MPWVEAIHLIPIHVPRSTENFTMSSTETSTDTIPTATTPSLPTSSGRWEALIVPFAKTLKRDLAIVEARLVEETEGRDDDALTILANTPEDTFVRWLTAEPVKAKDAMIRAAVTAFKASFKPVAATPIPSAVAPATSPMPGTAGFAGGMRGNMLPRLPTELSALESLVVGGVLRGGITDAEVVGAVKGEMADAISLFDAPEKIVDAIERYSETMATPVSDLEAVLALVNDIRKTRRLDDLDDITVNATTASPRNRKEAVRRVREILYPALAAHFTQVHAWFEANRAQGLDPTTMFGAISAMVSGNPAAAASYMQVAPVDGLISATAELNEAVNQTFAPIYTRPTLKAMAHHAMKIAAYLDPNQPKLAMILANTGKANRDELIKALGINITTAYLRNERAMMEYVYAAMQMRNTGEADLPVYATQLHQVGVTIPWAQLGQAAMSVASPSLPTQTARARMSDGPRHRPFDEVVDPDLRSRSR